MHREYLTHGRTKKKYLIGFLFALVLSLAAFFAPHSNVLIALFCIAQAAVVLLYFLNLSHETKPRWNLITLLFMFMVCVLIVFGSIWIMYNLNYNLM